MAVAHNIENTATPAPIMASLESEMPICLEYMNFNDKLTKISINENVFHSL